MRRLYDWYSRRNPWNRRLLLLVLSLVVAGLTFWLVPTPYYITAPGAAIDTARMVAVPGSTARDGQFYMLVVTTQPANLFWYLYARLDPRADLESPQEFLGDIPDYPKYMELTRRMMTDSQITAKSVALYLAGYGKGPRAIGAEVTALTDESPSKGFLAPGDVIIGVEGAVISSVEGLRAVLAEVEPGRALSVRIRREGAELSLTVPTIRHPDPERKGAALGLFLADLLDFDVPVPVKITTGPISGPSAGLVFTLQIIDQLTPGGIAGDLVVAATGTIEADGRVGAIGGVQQKVFAAETAGADVFFVPRKNYDAAKQVATRTEVVAVDDVRDALAWLKAYREKRGA